MLAEARGFRLQKMPTSASCTAGTGGVWPPPPTQAFGLGWPSTVATQPPSAANSAAASPGRAATAAIAAATGGSAAGSAPASPPASMSRTMWLLEGQTQQTVRAEALQTHISQLELQLRAQLQAATRAEQQRCDAIKLHAAMAHDLAAAQHERDALAARLAQYAALGEDQTARLTEAAAINEAQGAELQRVQLEHKVVLGQLVALEAGEADTAAQLDAARDENRRLLGDLQEVSQLIELLEGEKGSVRARLGAKDRAYKQQLREAADEIDGLKEQLGAAEQQAAELAGQVAEMRSQREAEAAQLEMISGLSGGRRASSCGGGGACGAAGGSPSRGGGLGGGGGFGGGGGGGGGGGSGEDELERLRDENRMLEAQLSLLSEKMYGSPARGAAAQRDKLQAALEAEVAQRVNLQRELSGLKEQRRAQDDHTTALSAVQQRQQNALERTRAELRSANFDHALKLSGGGGGGDGGGGGGGGDEPSARPSRDPIRAPSYHPPPQPAGVARTGYGLSRTAHGGVRPSPSMQSLFSTRGQSPQRARSVGGRGRFGTVDREDCFDRDSPHKLSAAVARAMAASANGTPTSLSALAGVGGSATPATNGPGTPA